MKNILAIGLILTLFASCNNSGDKKDGPTSDSNTTLNTPEKYNDFIVGLSDDVGREFALLSILIWTPTAPANDLDSGLIRYKSTCEKSLKSISSLGEYDGNTEFRDGMKELLTYYSSLASNEFPKLISYAKAGFHDTPDSVKVLEISDAMSKKESVMVDKLIKVQEAFVSKYGIGLNERGDPMDPSQFKLEE